MNITHGVFLLYLSFVSMGVHAQTPVSYSYDASGNRVKREIVLAKSQSAPREYSEVAADYAIKPRLQSMEERHHRDKRSAIRKNDCWQVCRYGVP